MISKRTLVTTARVLRQIRHDPRTLALLMIMPALLVGLIAWMFTDTSLFNRVGPETIALFPFIVMFLVTSITTLRERRSGTLERLLALPLRKGEFIAGYAIAFGIVAAVQTLITVAFAVWVCGLSVSGPLALLFVVAVVDALLGTSLGLFASAFAATEFQVVQFMPAFIFPQILLGGIFVPRAQMPGILHGIGDWLPLSHAIDALAAVSANSHSAAWVWMQIAIIFAWAGGALAAASMTLRRRTA